MFLDSFALQAPSDALVYTVYCLLAFGYLRIGALMIDSLSVKKTYDVLVSNWISLAGMLAVLMVWLF